MNKLTANTRGVQTMGLVIGIVIVVVIGAAVVYALSNTNTNTNVNANANESMMEENGNTNEAMEDDSMMEEMNTSDTMMEDDDQMMEDANTNEAMEDDSMMEETNDNTNSVSAAGEYTPYSQVAFAEASDKKRVLFFYASWCPTCRPADADITAHADQIPDGVVVFRTDYDSESALKSQYGVTYQHTFVQVDANGEIVKKWNGGGIDEIVSNTI